MEELSVNKMSDIALKIDTTYENLLDITGRCNADVSFIGNYDDVKIIIGRLINLGYEPDIVELVPVDEYDKEYILSVYDYAIYVEKMYQNGQYVSDESNVVFMMDYCNSALLKGLSDESIKCIISVENDGDNDFNDDDSDWEEVICNDCNDCCSCDSSYYVNGKKVSKDEYYKEAMTLSEDFRTSVKRFCEMMDRYNDILASF